MKRASLKVIFCLAVVGLAWVLGAFSAAPQFTVEGSTTYERNRITRLEQSLNFTQEPMPSGWEVTISPQDQFEKYVRDHNLPTDIAYTFVGLDHTYINEYFLVWATDPQVRFVLGHEAGHMICACRSEEKADAIAHILACEDRPQLEK
jgi:hypothetical protein